MDSRKLGAAAAALVVAATAVTGCSKADDATPNNVAWSPVTGDNFTSNPGAWQTDGVPAPAAGVTMVGNPVAAQAVANAGLPQNTITASANNTTVYYPEAPAIPGLPVSQQQTAPPPAPMQRPVNTRPWHYTPHQIEVYQQICRTGTWNNWRAGVEIQSQTCWTLYGRQLGVRPWHPGQPRPWERPSWPRPWFEADFHADVPVMWVYPPTWHAPRPQPVISVSIGINIPSNPYARPNPHHHDPYYPVWAVTPGLPVAVHGQARVVSPWLPIYAEASVSAGTYVAPPVFPGVTLGTIPTDGKAKIVTAVPGSDVVGNVNTDGAVLVPIAAAVKGATVYNGSAADLSKALGKDVDARVATAAELDGSASPATTSSPKTGSKTSAKDAPESTTKAGSKKSDDKTTSKDAPKDAPKTSEKKTTSAKTTDAKTSEAPKTTEKKTTAPETTEKKTTEPKKPETTEATKTAPKATEPKVTIPEITPPKITLPTVTTSKVPVPEITVPKITIPKVEKPKPKTTEPAATTTTTTAPK